MKYWASPYKLYASTHLNAQVDRGERAGALIKVEFNSGELGYGDFHRPNLLAHLNQFETLKILRNSTGSLEMLKTIDMARRDAEGHYRFDASKKIKNHFLITDIENFSYLDLLYLESSGFDRFKIKMGRSLRRETLALKELVEKSADTTKFRLDFNTSLDKNDFKLWIKKQASWLVKKIDFIEDPVKYEASYWSFLQKEYGLKLALDLAADPLQVTEESSFAVIVVKPALQDENKIVHRYKNQSVEFVWTHYMDHPLGQSGAIASALKAKESLGDQLLQCGLLGENIYPDLDANDYIGNDGPWVQASSERAWGFSDYLQDLKWFPLD